jgi:hypothetical protein
LDVGELLFMDWWWLRNLVHPPSCRSIQFEIAQKILKASFFADPLLASAHGECEFRIPWRVWHVFWGEGLLFRCCSEVIGS